MGVPLSDSAYGNHQRLSRLNEFLASGTNNNSAPIPLRQTLAITNPISSQGPRDAPIPGDAGPSTICNRNTEANNRRNNVSQAEPPSNSGAPTGRHTHNNTEAGQNHATTDNFRFMDKHVLRTLIQAAQFHFEDYLSEEACHRFLVEEKSKLAQLGERFGFHTSMMLNSMPTTMSTIIKRLGLYCSFQEQAVCAKCWTLYEAIPDSLNWAKQKLHPTITRHCTAPFYTNTRNLSTETGEGPRTCDEPIFTQFTASGKIAWRPVKVFCYQKLEDWLQRKLLVDQFEDLLDEPLRYVPQDGVMRDIWDGSVWKSLKFPSTDPALYTSSSGNLVFSLYVDWFNPHGNKIGGKSLEAGAITLVCLNLPPEHRYQEQNIFLFGITPGQPSINDIYKVLQPLVNEFLDFSTGVWFTQTQRNPTGRKIQAIMLPLIADLPALRKVAGFASHSATLFCSFCKLRVQQIDLVDPREFPPREHEDHMEWARKWLDSPNLTRRDAIVKEHGVRYSALNELPYWKPLEHSSIDVMHALMLGVLKDHSLSYLALAAAGKKLELDLKKLRKFQKVTQGPVFEALLEKRNHNKKRTADDPEHPAKRRLTRQNLEALGSSGPSIHPQTRSHPTPLHLKSTSSNKKSSLSHLKSTSLHLKGNSQASSSTAHGYSLRPRLTTPQPSRSSHATPRAQSSIGSKRSLVRSMASERDTQLQEATPDRDFGDRMPHMLSEEVEAVRRAIEQTSLPSWVDRLPLRLGAASAGSLKAAEWGILYTAFYPLVLLPLWQLSNENENHKVLMDNLLQVVRITHLLNHRMISKDNLAAIHKAILRY